MLGEGVIAGVLDDALAHAQGQVQAAKGWVTLLEPGDDAQCMQVVIEAQPEAAAKPASRSRRKPAATEAAADAIGEAPAEAAPKRRAPVRRKAAAAESAGSGEPAGE